VLRRAALPASGNGAEAGEPPMPLEGRKLHVNIDWNEERNTP
jgi:hypothetical protein